MTSDLEELEERALDEARAKDEAHVLGEDDDFSPEWIERTITTMIDDTWLEAAWRDSARVVFYSFRVGTNPDKIAQASGLSRTFVREKAEILRKNRVFLKDDEKPMKPGRIGCASKDDREFLIEVVLFVMCAEGLVQKSFDETPPSNTPTPPTFPTEVASPPLGLAYLCRWCRKNSSPRKNPRGALPKCDECRNKVGRKRIVVLCPECKVNPSPHAMRLGSPTYVGEPPLCASCRSKREPGAPPTPERSPL